MTDQYATAPRHGTPNGDIPVTEFRRVQESQEFANLKKVFRGFAFPMTAAFMIWYLLYVLLSTFATDFMSIKALGNLTWGLILGLLQFVTTFLITWLYIRHMNANVDPIARQLRDELEGNLR